MPARRACSVEDPPSEEVARKARATLLNYAGEPGTCWMCLARGWWIRNRHGYIVLVDDHGLNHTTSCSKRPGQGEFDA